jgi:hypothetical protein
MRKEAQPVKDDGDPAQAPDWPSKDYDGNCVVQIVAHDGQRSVSFALDHEGLDDQRDRFPSPAAPCGP